jgi:hypothetical protein
MSAAAIEAIGTCELCGLTDHHLVDGVCPTCRPKCISALVPDAALSPPSLESTVCGDRGFADGIEARAARQGGRDCGFITRARGAFMELGAAARLVFSNLDMPADENLGDEGGRR